MVKLTYNPKTKDLDIVCNQLGCAPGDSEQSIFFRNYILSNVRRRVEGAKNDTEVLEALTILETNKFKSEKTYVTDGKMIIEYSMIIDE